LIGFALGFGTEPGLVVSTFLKSPSPPLAVDVTVFFGCGVPLRARAAAS
jgi:hypothetical protein